MGYFRLSRNRLEIRSQMFSTVGYSRKTFQSLWSYSVRTVLKAFFRSAKSRSMPPLWPPALEELVVLVGLDKDDGSRSKGELLAVEDQDAAAFGHDKLMVPLVPVRGR